MEYKVDKESSSIEKVKNLVGNHLNISILGTFLAVLTVCLFTIGSAVEFPESWIIAKPIGKWIGNSVKYITKEWSWALDGISIVITYILVYIKKGLVFIPWPAAIIGISLVAWRMLNWKNGLFALVALLIVAMFGLWESAMETLAITGTSVILCIAIALPIGIWSAKSDTVDAIMRPILDGMQTMPSFVYLVPVIMFFSLGNVPAVIATIVYSVPPGIRLTNLGIRQVDPEVVEAARSFGTNPFQLLFKVQIPMAVPTIMAGINQTVMMALAMATIAALVGAGGLGLDVWRGLGRQRPGDALMGGIGIVVLAILIDRITQAFAKARQEALKGSL